MSCILRSAKKSLHFALGRAKRGEKPEAVISIALCIGLCQAQRKPKTENFPFCPGRARCGEKPQQRFSLRSALGCAWPAEKPKTAMFLEFCAGVRQAQRKTYNTQFPCGLIVRPSSSLRSSTLEKRQHLFEVSDSPNMLSLTTLTCPCILTPSPSSILGSVI